MSGPCCGIVPTVYISGQWSCSECGSIAVTDIAKLIDEFNDWALTSGAFKSEQDKQCECGAEKTVNSNCHAFYCPKYKKD